MICPQFRPLVGGYERAAERLSIELVRQGQDVTVVAERRQWKWPKLERIEGVVIRRLPCVYRPRMHIATALLSLAVYLLLYGRRFDVWHVHQYGAHATVAILLAKLIRRPAVLKITNTAGQGISRATAATPLSLIQVWAHRHADGCVAVSDEAAQEVAHFGIPVDRVAKIGNGVDMKMFRPVVADERAALRITLGLPDRNTAIYVGRLSGEKNPLGLLEAWALARPHFREPWTLVMVGDGPQRALVGERIRDLGLGDCVRTVGLSDRVQDWLGASDVLLQASHWEGLSNTVLEAMASGLPAVVTSVSGMDDLIGRTGAGSIVPVGDMKAFAQAIVDLNADSGLRRSMGAKAREAVIQHYSAEVVARRHLAFYRCLPRTAHAGFA